MKKILSLIMSFVMLISGISAFSSVTYAASYSQELKDKGFSDSYVTALTSLHEKYPNWNFVPFVTGLDWNTAVAGERSKHSNQVIQKPMIITATIPLAIRTEIILCKREAVGFLPPRVQLNTIWTHEIG